MKKKSLSVKKKIRNSFLFNYLKIPKIKRVYREFEKSLDSNINNKKIAVAVSGGPDSLSLSYFTACYALKKNYILKKLTVCPSLFLVDQIAWLWLFYLSVIQ